jgi:hypothetical protein
MIFFKSVATGLLAVLLMWIVIVLTFLMRLNSTRKVAGISGLGATAGGWGLLMQTPMVILLLTIAFGSGLFVAGRLLNR